MIPVATIKWKPQIEGRITQRFGENAVSYYKDRGLKGHPGIDTTINYGSNIRTHMPAFVYRTMDKDNGTAGASGYTSVRMLTQIKGGVYVESVVGHCYNIKVNEGDSIPENWIIATEGNSGTVFSGGIEYKENNPNKGTKGKHRHWQYRLVIAVKKRTKGKKYIMNSSGGYYKHEGSMFEIVLDNGFRGCIDPNLFKYKNTPTENTKMTTSFIWYWTKKNYPELFEKYAPKAQK